MRCGECGGKNLAVKTAKGKSFPYKNRESVPLTYDVDLTTCLDCDNIIMKPGDAKKLDYGIELSLGDEAGNA